ncbi:hypothetical protein DPMN_110378 [Dreissena polymorpha]|uniref:Uncharacterized protein n=1 Tax=Dreissena polymorpha TaxID=45954 RepID=A0A9D4QNX5_DREPO|nr:hypothetical protein DPMN_110378 [Dreissena polymorpha]
MLRSAGCEISRIRLAKLRAGYTSWAHMIRLSLVVQVSHTEMQTYCHAPLVSSVLNRKVEICNKINKEK